VDNFPGRIFKAKDQHQSRNLTRKNMFRLRQVDIEESGYRHDLLA